MSDDDYYGDYDDFEDGMWDADPAPDLADDLAEHAAYSPVWQDDPVGELEPYHSDWEYYSDDYYDDDPVLKNTTLDGSMCAPISKMSSKTGKRGKKRKLDEVRESQTAVKRGSLMDCIRGTVWAQEEKEKQVAFQLGHQESVALLKNWRDMFKSDSGMLHTFGRGQLKLDESWANDLSLADMGLLSNEEKPGVQERAQLTDEREGSLIDVEDGGQNQDDLDTVDESEQLLEMPNFKNNGSDQMKHVVTGCSVGSDIEDIVEDTSNPRKRKKLAGPTSLPGLHGSNYTAASVVLPQDLDITTKNQMRSKGAGENAGDIDNTSEGVGNSSTLAISIHEPAAHSRKRKLSFEAEVSEALDNTSDKHRVKRTLSAGLAQAQDTKGGKLRTAPRPTRSASYISSPDQASSVYPDRLIRPLPRRSLKSRLSQEAAESITFPPNPPSTSLPAYSHYGENGEFLNDSKVLVQHNGAVYDHEHEHDHDHDHDHDDDDHDHEHCPHHHCHHDHDDDDLDSADDLSPIALRHSSNYRSSPRSPRLRHGRYGSHGGKGSNAPDGYEAFENTNNKKKRKIPTSGSLSLHHSSLTSDVASMGINGPRDGTSEDPQHYYGSPSPSGVGMQGAGRGRSSRKSVTRNPLGVSVNGSNARNGLSKYEQNVGMNNKGTDMHPDDGCDTSDDDLGDESRPDQGIISAAIANATALLRNPLGKGQENVGVLDQQAKSAPSNSQFTFTCEAEAKGVKFPEQSLYSPDYSQRVNSSLPQPSAVPGPKYQTQGSQSNPNTQSQHAQQMRAPLQPVASSSAQGKKPRRRKGDVYALAARQRKLQQEYMNLQHPPAPEDIWVCEFCEYESIFGEPPRALIRQYEMKDRRERKRLAEKQRLLEKAKLKGRKGKKQTKNAARAANHAAQQPINQQSYDQQTLDPGDEYLDDGYDEDPTPMPAPAPPNIRQPAMPGSYHAGKAGSGEIDRGGTR